MDFLTRLSAFGKFSFEDDGQKITIIQRNYVMILLALAVLAFCFLAFGAYVLYPPHNVMRFTWWFYILLFIGILTLVVLGFLSVTKKHILVVDRARKLLIYDGKEFLFKDIETFRSRRPKYLADGMNNIVIEFFANGRRESVFSFTPLSGRFLIFVADKINDIIAQER